MNFFNSPDSLILDHSSFRIRFLNLALALALTGSYFPLTLLRSISYEIVLLPLPKAFPIDLREYFLSSKMLISRRSARDKSLMCFMR